MVIFSTWGVSWRCVDCKCFYDYEKECPRIKWNLISFNCFKGWLLLLLLLTYLRQTCCETFSTDKIIIFLVSLLFDKFWYKSFADEKYLFLLSTTSSSNEQNVVHACLLNLNSRIPRNVPSIVYETCLDMQQKHTHTAQSIVSKQCSITP
jgi:hypothetical protein